MDELPSHWELSKVYGSASEAVKGLRKNDEKFQLHEVDTEKTPQEWIEVEQLMQRTWRSDKVGIGKDAQNLGHTTIEVVRIERVENPTKIRDYNNKKHKLVEDGRQLCEVEKLPGSSGPVETARHLKQDGFLCKQVLMQMNEHYLFHGTKEDNVFIIQRDGLDNRFGNRNSLLGPGIYMAESSTKADQYTDMKTDRADENFHQVFLVRALLGDIFLNKDKSPPKFERPPCKKCLKVKCVCIDAVHYDSIVDDAGRLFREFVVYDSSQCYPEYLVTYRRVKPSQTTTTPQSAPAVPKPQPAATNQSAPAVTKPQPAATNQSGPAKTSQPVQAVVRHPAALSPVRQPNPSVGIAIISPANAPQATGRAGTRVGYSASPGRVRTAAVSRCSKACWKKSASVFVPILFVVTLLGLTALGLYMVITGAKDHRCACQLYLGSMWLLFILIASGNGVYYWRNGRLNYCVWLMIIPCPAQTIASLIELCDRLSADVRACGHDASIYASLILSLACLIGLLMYYCRHLCCPYWFRDGCRR